MPVRTAFASSRHLTSPNPELDKKVRSTVPGMAHWAGTGPEGATCGGCCYHVAISGRRKRTKMRCQRYQILMGRTGANDIPKQTEACRHFRARER
jgi:hypothetical protein